MYRVVCLLLFIAFQGALTQDDCVPDQVRDINMLLNHTLIWPASENCEVTHYIIYVHSDDGLEYMYQTDDTFLDVSFLPACERYRFTIMAFYVHMSIPTYIYADVPAPPGANLTISDFSLTEYDEGLLLEWEVERQYAHCAQRYRVITWDLENSPRDIYTSYSYMMIRDLVTCTTYQVGVMAIYNLGLEGPAALKTYTAPATTASAPQLESVRPGVSYVDMTWNLPSYSSNRCTITQLIIDGSPYVNLTIPIQDSPTRPLVPVHVDNLQPDRMYLFRITMVNSGGPTQPFLVGFQTLPLTD